jgi:deoxyribonuclease V
VLCCLDVDYRSDRVVAACVGFADWSDRAAAFEETLCSHARPAPYTSGELYLRELPYLTAVLQKLPRLPDLIVVDGFVWLGPGRPGLGAYLHQALDGRAVVVGVAKRPFLGNSEGLAVLRGQSRLPLWVSAVGVPVAQAAAGVAAMHGPHRLPTLLKRVDRLARDCYSVGPC